MSQDFTDNFFDGSHVAQSDMEAANDNFAALKSCFSGSTSPPNAVAGMWWYDTTTNILKVYRTTPTALWLSVWDFANNKPVITNLSDEITGAMISSAIKDAAAGTASLRTLGTGSTQACAGNDSRIAAPTSGTTYKILTLRDEVLSVGDGWSGTIYSYSADFAALKSGTITVYFQDCLTTAVAGHTKYANLYKNGALIQEWTTTVASYQVRTYNLTVSVGDYMNLIHKASYDSNPGLVRYQRVYSGTQVGAVCYGP